MAELKLPQSWQDWHITEELGEGAYGRVYRAEKENGGVTAVSAIKVIQVPSERSELLSLRREFQPEEELRRNLKEMVDGYTNEIRAMYRLQGHTHIVSIQDHAVEEMKDGLGWRIFIRMEYLQPFDDYAMTHSFSREEIIRIGISLCEALSVCARNDILHRDVKPENMFVTESGQFKLGDFGIAKALDRTISSYSSKGTFSYMAPEVFQGKPYDSRADLYSTGVILYKLANRNRDPFIDPEKQIITHQDREQAMSRRMQGEKLPAPADADEKLAKVILKACEFNPKDRYDTPDAMMRALKEIVQKKKGPVKKARKKWILPLCAAVALLITGSIIFLSRTSGRVPAGNSVFQDYYGIRFALPDGFETDPEQSTEEIPVWIRGHLKIGFQWEDHEYSLDGEHSIMIAGIEAIFNPERMLPSGPDKYIFASFRNPVQEKGGSITIFLVGPEEELVNEKNSADFLEMLTGAEQIAETSVLQSK